MKKTTDASRAASRRERELAAEDFLDVLFRAAIVFRERF
jgi:hypothetical protein